MSRGGVRVAIVGALVALAGCGSGGGLSTPSPFAGAWAGVMGASAGGVDSGMPTAISLSVDRKGHLTGTWTDAGSSGKLSGEVNNGGTLTLAVASPSPSPDVVTGRGVTTIAGDGSWQGSLPVTTEGSAGVSIEFQVQKQ